VTMKKEADNEGLLIQYLLGKLSEQEQLRVEEMFFNNDLYSEQLLSIENGLFHDYAQGKLPPGDRELFEKRLLTSERSRRRAMLASALANKISEAALLEPAESGFAEHRPQSWQSLKSFFSMQSAAVRFSLVTLVVLLLGSIWLVNEILMLRTELDRFRTERAVQEERLQQLTEQKRAHADDLSLKLKRELDVNAMLKQELSEVQAQSDKEERRFPATNSFVLAPAPVRSRANSPKRLYVYVPRSARLLKFQLSLKEKVIYKSYQATLLTAEGREKWSQKRLRAKRTKSGQSLALKLPARLLKKGDYELRLKGLASNGALKETGNHYYFSVAQK
jgi:hypothetical protein